MAIGRATIIRDDELAKSQLPDVVPTKKNASRKPQHW